MAYAPVSKTGNAGSSPATFTKCLHVTRTRGDDPALSQLLRLPQEFHPHMRGWTAMEVG